MEERQNVTEEQVESKNEPQGADEKKFTQADVDRIVRERLSRQKATAAAEKNSENEARAQELAEMETGIRRKESRLDCKEYLLDKGLPVELLDVIDTDDSKAFQEKAGRVMEVFKGYGHQSAPLASTEPNMYGDGAVASAFRNPKHKPKPYEILGDDE